MFLTKTQKTPYLPSVASFPNRYDSAIARNGWGKVRSKGDNLLTRLLVNCSQKEGFRAKRGFSVPAKHDAPQHSSNAFDSAFGFQCFSF